MSSIPPIASSASSEVNEKKEKNSYILSLEEWPPLPSILAKQNRKIEASTTLPPTTKAVVQAAKPLVEKKEREEKDHSNLVSKVRENYFAHPNEDIASKSS